jgi:L-asparaginase
LKIRIITTGGTIDKIYFDRKDQFQVGEPQIAELLREANVTFDYEIVSILQKDSLDLTDEDRRLIYRTVESAEERYIVLTHGTDTMLVTAKMLQQIPDKVIILTGSMQPAKFRLSDACFNIGHAIAAVQLLPDGVYVAMNGCVFKPDKARKNVELNRFEEL